jgi:hypothetical protein
MPLIIRPASADDQYAITAIVRAARIYPRDLDWQRFLLAQWGQDIIGVGQVRPHRDGSRELASIWAPLATGRSAKTRPSTGEMIWTVSVMKAPWNHQQGRART